MDYMAFGKLDPFVAAEIVKGFSIACKENGCALIGGETAEMPGVYQLGDYDLSGTIVGIVEKSKIIKGEKLFLEMCSLEFHRPDFIRTVILLQEKFFSKNIS
jgi:phosphoribosylaminoimidazole (AIR) synthetase